MTPAPSTGPVAWSSGGLRPLPPLSTAQARAAGITKAQLAGPDFRSLLRGWWISARVPYDRSQHTEAALLLHPDGAVATHTSAARAIGAPVPRDPFEHITVARRGDRRRREGVRCHVAALQAGDVRTVRRLRISEPHRMFVELASMLGLVDLVVVGDWLVRRKELTCESLVEHCGRSSDQHARQARQAAAYVRARVDSPMETRLRMLIVLAGLPEPVVNLSVRDEHGIVVMRLDLSYPGVRVAVEYDGRQHVEIVDQWEHDNERRDELDDGEWRLVVVTSKGIYKEPERTVQRVWRALRQRGYRPLQPPTDGSRLHFGQ